MLGTIIASHMAAFGRSRCLNVPICITVLIVLRGVCDTNPRQAQLLRVLLQPWWLKPCDNRKNSATQGRPGMGNREADGGRCISWCKDRYRGEIIAAGCGVSGAIKIIQLSPSRRPITLDPSPSPVGLPTEAGTLLASDGDTPTPFAITSVAWAPSCGRSCHLIATGGRDGHVRIWRVKPAEEEADVDGEGGDPKWSANVVADFDHHKSAVGRVEWNITGTVLSSAGNDGRVRLWKATIGNVWRTAGSIGVEQSEDTQYADVNMGPNVIVASNRYRVFYPDTISAIMTGLKNVWNVIPFTIPMPVWSD